ncbi:tetratricopeptide repeat protein [Gemmata sp. G18]|uniref:Tetratricopeptide repeat protein n=1 Tax=Gemmata palustris TaxID=2822762 RepID=A0ABS5C159_9BACT|nr:tetratricopeptide repeat protein [Gemmata palustris]MBP3958858.1 tetratricopeptide repeat protein [Gemmata palustris]
MSVPLLVELFDRLPEFRLGDDEDLWTAGAQGALRAFRDAARAHYTEGTLQRILATGAVTARRAAARAIGLTGTAESVPATAVALRDEDPLVRHFATDSLWELWFRAGTEEQTQRLQEATREPDAAKARAELESLLREAPGFAEVHNQRAIWFFKRGEFARAAEDCETVLRLNPHHFGAAAGMGQCFLKLNRPRAALRAFRQALEINPNLDLHETVRALEALGE